MKLTRHVNLSLLSLLFLHAGFWAIYFNKENRGKAHFQSWHAYFGVVMMAASTCNVVQGLIQSGKQYAPPVWKNALHVWFGSMGVAAGVAAMLSGFNSNWALFKFPDPRLRFGAMALIIVAAALVVIRRTLSRKALKRA